MTDINELEEQRTELIVRIKKIEHDLESPINKDSDEGAMDMKNREILYSLYEIEKKNLKRIEKDLFNLDSL